ncbi:hypothetical protein MSAN_01876300 [Mycena sanguinolenta]|uniref:F-box domain-containing protein n=1 Tax=Mycena sanguinolenta TaxID=230812 RepID=A0A8H7CSC5_9AGAR|nr:hypothetical protein MSAN_01876300 [Mycena sanguinolenta]
MLRRQRSLVAFIAGSSATNLALQEKEGQDAVPPLPVAKHAHADAPEKSGGLFRRVSNLLRSGSGNGSPTSARYRAATSTPDVRNPSPKPTGSPVSGHSTGGKLVKRPSVKRGDKKAKSLKDASTQRISENTPGREEQPRDKRKWGTMSSKSSKTSASHRNPPSASASARPSSSFSRGENEGEEEEDDIRRPSGLGRAASLREMLRNAEQQGRHRRSISAAMASDGRKSQDTDVREKRRTQARDADSAYASASALSSSRSSPFSDDDGEEDDIRRPSGLGPAARAFNDSDHAHFPALPHHSHTHPGDPSARDGDRERARTLSSPAQMQMPEERQTKLNALHALLRLPPPSSAAYSSQTHLPAGGLPAPVWRLVLAHVGVADAARAARVSRVLCAAARGRLYGVVDLRGRGGLGDGDGDEADDFDGEGGDADAHGEGDDGTDGRESRGSTSRRRRRRREEGLMRALGTAHIAARVEGVVCAGWPPWPWASITEIHFPALRSLTIFPPDAPGTPSPISASAPPKIPTTPTALHPTRTDPTTRLLAFIRVHPTLERLAIVGGEESGFGDDEIPPEEPQQADEDKHAPVVPFLPRLTHLHALPALAVRILEGITASPFCAPAPSTTTPTSTPTKQGLSAASLALLAPDPKRSRMSGWGRMGERESHTPEADADAPPADATQTQTTGTATPPMATSTRTPSRERAPQRIPRKPPPSAFSEDGHEGAVEVEMVRGEKVELRRVGSVGRAARAVYVKARPAAASAASWVKTAPHAHPLRVLRVAVPRPLYEGAAGGGRVGRAVGGVLARGGGAGGAPAAKVQAEKRNRSKSKTRGTEEDNRKLGLAVHLLFGPRVERRTLEKVLRTLGSGIDEVVVASIPRLPPSAVAPGRGRSGREEEPEKKLPQTGKLERGVELLEVRSPVRVAELYKIVAAVLPRYPALRTLLLTRPAEAGFSMGAPSVPPSPRSPSTFAPSAPSTPRVPTTPSLRVPPSPLMPPPPSPGLRAPPSPSLRAPPSPSARGSPSSLYPPPSPFTLAPPPGLRLSAAHPDAWAWEWDGWGDAGDVLAGIDAPALPLHALQPRPVPDVPGGHR